MMSTMIWMATSHKFEFVFAIVLLLVPNSRDWWNNSLQVNSKIEQIIWLVHGAAV